MLLLLGGAALFYFLRYRRPRRKKRSSPGKNRGRLTRREEAAWNLLQIRGYRLEEIHPAIPVTFTVENKSRRFTHRSGFTVVKSGKVYLVKVKQGEGASLSTPVLRRELMLDFLFFRPAALFLYDSERDRLQKLSFSCGGGYMGNTDNRFLLLSLLLLVIAGVALLCRLLI